MEKKFSERRGIVDSISSIQTESMNDALRHSLWNCIYSQYESNRSYSTDWNKLAKAIAEYFRKVPVDTVDCLSDRFSQIWVKDYFYEIEWYEVYNLIEFLVRFNENIREYPEYRGERLVSRYNNIFKRELSGYRFIAGLLAPISSPTETAAISDAIEATSRTGLKGAHEHLESALKLLGKKPEPDYRNAVKEAISAVESVSRQLCGDKSEGVAGALAILEEKMEIHGALKAGFVKLYGYSSDEDGIRHAIMDEVDVDFDEAKYMIVACSAFVNYLISKADSCGLLPK